MTEVRAAGDLTIDVAGETLVLQPERAMFWPRRRTVFIADAHIGKAATLRAGGIPAPRGTTLHALTRLDALLARTAAARLVFLGDLLHAREGRDPDTLRQLTEWRARHDALEVILVRGNHDRGAGDPPPESRITCVDAPTLDVPFVFDHHPRASDAGYVLAGHIHPGALLAGKGRQRERLACFWLGRRIGVLPAFGDFTGFGDITAQPGDRVYVIAADSVVDSSPG